MHLNADLVTFRRLMVTDLPLLYHWLTTDPVITHFWCHDEVTCSSEKRRIETGGWVRGY